jgi:putative acetyltransferase
MAAAIVESRQFPPELSLAAVVDDRIAGHVISSWVGLEGSDRRLLQLGPIGVLPELQGQGIGSALVRASLDATRALGEPLLLLEGNPAYYGRFGFVRADELGLLPPPEALYDWAFQVAVLDEAAELARGRVVYPPAFAH